MGITLLHSLVLARVRNAGYYTLFHRTESMRKYETFGTVGPLGKNDEKTIRKYETFGTVGPLGKNDEKTKILQDELRERLHAGNYEDAVGIAKELRKHAFYAYGGFHPVFASAVNNQALVHKSLGELQVANNLFELALDAYEKCVGKDHASYATVLSNLGTVQSSLGNLDIALKYYQDCLAIRTKLFPEDHADIISLQLLLGSVYRKQHLLNRAFEYQSKALTSFKQKFGLEHTATATSMNNLALTCKDLALKAKVDEKDPSKVAYYFGQAENLLHIACGVRARCLGSTHADFIASMHNLAEVYEAWDQKEKANNVRRSILEHLGHS